MRCGCSNCGAFMIHADEKEMCVCPECGSRCSACLGTNTVVSRESLKRLQNMDWITRDIARAENNFADRDDEPETDDRFGRWRG